MDILITAWYWLIGFCVMMYVLLDGVDLGIGILFPFFPNQRDRQTMISTILPVWDGNQTWLVLGTASLYGAFPLAFSLLLPALYLPILLMVLGLLFRGITFEFRLKAHKALPLWDGLFFLGSTVVTVIQGLVLGTFVTGFQLGKTGHILDFTLFTPFNMTCAIALLFGYALLGSTWVIAKTTGNLQKKMFSVAWIGLIIMSLGLLIISIWTPFISPAIWHIWFNPHYIYKLALLPFVTGCLILLCAYSIYQRREYILFWICLSIFMCSYAGVGISTWPYLIPHVMTTEQAAAPHSSLLFMFMGAAILLPFLLGYTLYSYYIFRGKITEMIGYD